MYNCIGSTLTQGEGLKKEPRTLFKLAKQGWGGLKNRNHAHYSSWLNRERKIARIDKQKQYYRVISNERRIVDVRVETTKDINC